ncbi:MAG: hypothetical protein E7415_01355 [Ruminococcaceae bacterium]|nr:hypothetical protein [Oscillospiraceae bacterium]
MKKLLSLILSIVILVISIPCTFASDSVEESNNISQIKNIIYLIPDGGGYALYDFANMVKVAGGFNAELFPYKTYTDTNPMSMSSQLAGSMTTAPVTGGVTDSAAAGTAMATGHKTVNGYVGIDKNGVPKANLVEAAESVGKATGIISTYDWTHATPATFTAHASNRGDKYNIYQQVENRGLEVVLGVGYGQVSAYATIQNAIDNGYTVVETKEDLLNVKPGDKIWGNVDPKGLPYDIESGETQANLAEMTKGAIEALSGDPDGFFLMVEGGKVDTGGHANNPAITTSEYLAFDAAFKVALDFAKGRTDTVVICAPDHDTGGMIIPENPEDVETAINAVVVGANTGKISWTTGSHTDQNVGVWVYVPEGVSLIEGLNPELGDTQNTRENYIIDNTDIAPWCADFMGVDLDALSEELFVNVSTIGKYNTLERKFTFNNTENGEKYVYSNHDEYYIDGEKISTSGRTAIYINNKFYVPAEMVDEEDWDYVTEWEVGDGITGNGSASNPYILDDAYDFMEFTSNMLAGDTYKGKFVRQIKDIDLTPFSEYQGIGANSTFAGTYDGYGKKIIVNITSDSNVSIFPKLTGVLMNVGTEGTIKSNKSGAYAAGIAYYVGSGGKIINCYSNATIEATNAGGITTYNYGTIGNCSFCGTVKGTNIVPIGMPYDENSSCVFWKCYYINNGSKGNLKYTHDEIVLGSDTQAKTQLAEILNSNRKGAASELGYNSSYVSYWTNDYGYPQHYIPSPIVEAVTIAPPESDVVDKGDGILLSATVTGQHNPPQDVTWSIDSEVSEGTTIASDGFLVVDKNETAASFSVMAKSDYDGSKTDTITITVGENVLSEPDGSRARPYLIETAEDFKTFSNEMIAENDYSSVYLRQTKNIDLSNLEGYNGVDSIQTFAGIYDGAGHTIKIGIESNTDECLFPNITGTIMNLGVTGSIKNELTAGAICSSIGAGGKLVNCWSNALVEGENPGGIASSNYGTIASCFFFGALNATSGEANDIANTVDSAVNLGNFYIGNDYVQSATNSEVTNTQLKDEVRNWLNVGLSDTAKTTRLPVSGFATWYYADGILSFVQDNTMNVGLDTLTVSLYGNTSIGTVYAAMYGADGIMSEFKQYPASETVEIEFDSNTDGANIKIMWWHGNMYPMCEAETISL